MSFYRAVEATSVTPFAARALDRALAATLVAAARHFEPDLTPKGAADRIARNGHAAAAVRAAFEEKMRIAGVEGAGIGRCLARLDALAAAWAEIAELQTANGDQFVYAKEEPVRRLLQDPLDDPPNMAPNRSWFAAGRSMRDTEPVALLKLRGPDGAPLSK